MELPYRDNVSIITFKGDNFLVLNLVSFKDGWLKFPQGGIDDGESVIEAAKREFLEEIGTDKIHIHGVSEHKNSYDWPQFIVERTGNRFRGQSQSFVVAEFKGDESDININPHEVSSYMWITREELIEFSNDPEHKLFENYNGVILKIIEEFSHVFKDN